MKNKVRGILQTEETSIKEISGEKEYINTLQMAEE